MSWPLVKPVIYCFLKLVDIFVFVGEPTETVTPSIMRRKSLNPKKLSLKDETAAAVDKPKSDVECLKEVLVQQTQNCEVKPEINNNLNGSDGTTKAVTRNEKQDHESSDFFIFEPSPSTASPRKCSCNTIRKDQTTQTPRNVQEWIKWLNSAATLPLAVNPTTVEPSLPSPSWSQSSDSEGSSPCRTPNKLKMYKCNVCDKIFPTPSKLRRHFLIHSGEKPYSCRVCGKPFNDPANLKRHHWSHIKEKPFICEECNGQFMTKRDAMMHLCPAVKRKRKVDGNSN